MASDGAACRRGIVLEVGLPPAVTCLWWRKAAARGGRSPAGMPAKPAREGDGPPTGENPFYLHERLLASVLRGVERPGPRVPGGIVLGCPEQD